MLRKLIGAIIRVIMRYPRPQCGIRYWQTHFDEMSHQSPLWAAPLSWPGGMTGYSTHITSYTLHIPHCLLHITSYTVPLAHCLLQIAFYTWLLTHLHIASYTYHLTHFILNISSYTFHLKYFILHIASYTFYLTNCVSVSHLYLRNLLKLSLRKLLNINKKSFENLFYKKLD